MDYRPFWFILRVKPQKREENLLGMAFHKVHESSNPLLGAPSLDQMGQRATSQGPAPLAPSQGGASSSERPS